MGGKPVGYLQSVATVKQIQVVRVGPNPGPHAGLRVPVDDLTTWLRRLGAGIGGIAFYRKLIFCLFFYRSEPE